MRELAVQAGNDTNQWEDRLALQLEINQLVEEIDQIAMTTEFNEMTLLSGRFAAGSGELDGFDPTLSTWELYNAMIVEEDDDGPNHMTLGDMRSLNLQVGANQWQRMQVNIMNMSSYGLDMHHLRLQTPVMDALFALTSFEDRQEFLTGTQLQDSDGEDILGGQLVAIGGAEGENLEILDDRGRLQGQSSILNHQMASQAVRAISVAILSVSMARAALGAVQNRLEFKIQNLDNQAENVQASESRIRDADMAREMTTFTRNNILFQASTAMLAQANALPQTVLQLIG
jgi:flagellin